MKWLCESFRGLACEDKRRDSPDVQYEVQKPESHAWCRVFTLLERAGVKEPAASRHQAHCGLRGHISGFGRKNQILNAVPQPTNGGRRATAVDVPTGLGTRSTPPPTPSPLTVCASSVQAFGVAEGLADQVGRGEGPMSRREKEVYYEARTIGKSGDMLLSVESEQASP